MLSTQSNKFIDSFTGFIRLLQTGVITGQTGITQRFEHIVIAATTGATEHSITIQNGGVKFHGVQGISKGCAAEISGFGFFD